MWHTGFVIVCVCCVTVWGGWKGCDHLSVCVFVCLGWVLLSLYVWYVTVYCVCVGGGGGEGGRSMC